MAKTDVITKLHEEYNFPLDILREYIYENMKITVTEFKKITDGIDSEVYDIGQHFVNIRRQTPNHFSCVKWAIDLER